MKTTNPIWYALVASLLIVPVASTASTAPIERTVEFPLLDQLFPSQSIHDAWERYPLLSKARRVTVEEEQQGGDKTCSEDTTGLLAGMIPTVHVPSPDDDPGALTEAERLALAQSLIDVENVIPSILPHHQKRGNKADLAKRFENGTDVDFYFDHVPRYKQVLTSWEETRDIVFQKGYTLILLGLQVEHSPIARFTNFLHNESGSHYATCK